jgi:hypothetical protein
MKSHSNSLKDLVERRPDRLVRWYLSLGKMGSVINMKAKVDNF